MLGPAYRPGLLASGARAGRLRESDDTLHDLLDRQSGGVEHFSSGSGL
jgi:hypothetical protein